MKNKLIIVLAVFVILAAYPIYRYKTNAKVVANTLLSHSNALGKWSYGSIASDFSGNLTVRNLSFTPKGYEGGFDIDSLKIKTDRGFIFKHNSQELEYILPEKATLAFNAIALNSKSSDLYEQLKNNGLWYALIGYAGSFGCQRESMETFKNSDISNFFTAEQIFNLDIYYSRLPDSSLDVDVIIDAEELFSTSWSSNIESSYVDDRIMPEELLVKTLYYTYLDNGMNSKRNKVCADNYKGSVAAYRLSAAEHLQRFFRVNYAKELSPELINWYQKSLMPDAEYNAIVEFPDRRYITELFALPQKLFFTNVDAQVSLDAVDYQKVTLQEVDFTKIDQEELMNEHIKKQEELKRGERERKRQEEQKRNPKVYKIGHSKQRMIGVSSLGSYVGKQLRLKMISGRPIIGELISINRETGMVVFKTSYKSGSAQLNLPLKKIISAELM